MHRLFWKLFLSFWLALMLFAGGTLVAASLYLDQMRARHEATSPSERMENLVTSGQAAADKGLESLRAWAREMDAKELVPMLVIDQDGRDLLRREVSSRALAHWNRHLLRPPEAGRDQGPPSRPVVRLESGQEYWLIPDFQGVTLGRFLTRPRVLAIPLVLATLVAGLACLLLARYLAGPLERLRAATLDYAKGNFRQRVGPGFGSRQDELADLAFAMDHMADRLASLIEAQRSLLRDVSHELRTPLARLQAALGLARQRGRAPTDAELDRIERESERLGELIGSILSFSRLDSGMQQARREHLDLTQLLREAAADTAIEAEGRGCTLRVTAPDEAPLSGDPLLLHSAIENILRNAVHHSPSGSEVRVALAEASAGYAIDIADSGRGVPPEMLERIFEPFVRVDDARGERSGGFGLGLAIARRAILAHGGSIAASNAEGGGLTVTIQLPKAA